MMKTRFLLIFLSLTTFLSAQDIDMYHLKKNDNFLLPVVPKEMTFDEFQIMSRTFRMQDMIYSAFVPGYVHFKARDFNTGYALLGLRTVAYSTLAYEAFFNATALQDSSFWWQLLNYNSLKADVKKHTLITASAVSAIGFSYLFDIIHGKYRLEKKQEAIRYKYTMKASLTMIDIPQTNSYGYGLNFKFYF